MSKKSDNLFKQIYKWYKNIMATDEQQKAAMNVKAHRVTINDVLYYVGRAQVSDIKEILDVERAVYDGQTPWNEKAFASELRRKSDRLYLVVRKNDRMVAFIGSSYSRGAKDLHVTNIAVLPEWQRKGIATFLLNTIIHKATKIDAKQVSLEVRASNEKAQKTYASLGFESHGVQAGYYFGDHEDAIDMVLPLKEKE
ncbi:ribosomal-protein-alanine N-acetyltransferase [Periweissella cryptocerci]|uniref:Ribosomal-protein-alanine N-acetyltransferase n=1 Tax=Periweissella cryptocerci TaxID=2506420 RepID=A0A4P6YX60_9LACO|nr:ribosomal protein S18-alanine N-acetyltransferase [Periweissella cryptocerci]QBO37482.1 ribosomal-protein-alanine N-acetyltransferase [Periweissella cryptocerci]